MPSVNSNHGIAHNEVERFFSKLLDTVKVLPVSLSEFELAELLVIVMSAQMNL